MTGLKACPDGPRSSCEMATRILARTWAEVAIQAPSAIDRPGIRPVTIAIAPIMSAWSRRLAGLGPPSAVRRAGPRP